jgi:hypothetical protein
MRRNFLILIVLITFLSIVVTSCSAEVGRVHIQEAGTFEKSIILDGSSVNLWTDLDVEYSDLSEMEYKIVLEQPDGSTESLTCDPLDVVEARMDRDAIIRGKTKISYLGKMACRVSLISGEVNVKVDFYYQGKDVTVFRADLVILNEE